MDDKKKTVAEPISNGNIFRVMIKLMLAVSAAFLIKNLLGKTWSGAIAIAICLVIFLTVIYVMRKREISLYRQQQALCIMLPILVFSISLFSGNYYSDDFPLYLAVIGLSGLFLEPSYTKIQMVEVTTLMILLYIINPKKADPLGQYIMCVGLEAVASYTFYLVIVRGRAFIKISEIKAREAEKLLESMKNLGVELQTNYEESTKRVEGMRAVDRRLESNTSELKNGSEMIADRTREVEKTCETVHDYMQITQTHIGALNQEVQQVEKALFANKSNLQVMDTQIQTVKHTVGTTQEVFTRLQEQIKEISESAKNLTSIASNTKMLALNASIEAARAGEQGKGFAVVASQVQSLALDSNQCSAQVIQVVGNIQNQIGVTTSQLEESTGAINNSLQSMVDLATGFDDLMSNFVSLYGNIEEQNKNIKNVDSIFESLRNMIGEMTDHTEENQAAVEAIAEAMMAYRSHMDKIIEDTKNIHDLSSSMLEISKDEA